MTANPYPDKDDAVPIELRLDRIARLYNSLDPAPFHEKELDAAADEYIVGAAEDLAGKPMRLIILLAEAEFAKPEAAQIGTSIRNHFAWREQVERRRLRAAWHRGRISFVIGLVFLVVCLFVRELLTPTDSKVQRILAEGLLIFGWVAMWGPIDVFFYGWWPIAGQRRLYARLSRLEVDVRPLK
jgi:hypothetical protein